MNNIGDAGLEGDDKEEVVAYHQLKIQQSPQGTSLSGSWSLSGASLTLNNLGGTVVRISKSVGGDMLIQPLQLGHDGGRKPRSLGLTSP